MFTSLDKALVALIMAILWILNNQFGMKIGLDEKTVADIIAVITPLLVYLIPNKKKESAPTS